MKSACANITSVYPTTCEEDIRTVILLRAADWARNFIIDYSLATISWRAQQKRTLPVPLLRIPTPIKVSEIVTKRARHPRGLAK